MNTTHTAGVLDTRPPSGPHYQGQISSEATGATVALTYNDEGGYNAARLVLVWNALAHLDNDAVTRLGRSLERFNSDELRDLLADDGF